MDASPRTNRQLRKNALAGTKHFAELPAQKLAAPHRSRVGRPDLTRAASRAGKKSEEEP